jgi:general secretion pathway protein F
VRYRIDLHGAAADTESLVIEAEDEAAALAEVEIRGVRVLRLTALDSSALIPLQPTRFPLSLFCQELLSLLDAGLSLPEALQVLVKKEKQAGVKSVLSAVQQGLRDGRSLSASLALYPGCFPELFLAGVRASETTGGLVSSLQRYLDYQQQFDAIRKKLVSASVYPLVLVVAGSCVALFLLGYVVPRFSVVFESSGHEIPFASRAMLDIGSWLYGHWQGALAVFLALVSALVFAFLQASFRQHLLTRILRLPFLREQATIFFLSRFYRALGLLLQSGIPLVKALNMARGMLSPSQQARLAQVIQDVQEGQTFSIALARQNLSTPVADSLLAVGERSGRMDEMLERCARFHDDEIGRYVDVASKLLEPVLMAIIGIAVGAIVVLMYMPIFDLAGSIE